MDLVLTWWLTIELLGLAVLPLALALFRNLPDRGYAFAKPLGVLLTGYLLWLTGLLHLVPNRRGSIVLIVALLAVGSLAIAARRGENLAAFFRERRASIIATEAVFLVAFGLWAIVRAFSPDILGTEQPMDFGFYNAILRSEYFPPNDMWLAGQSISYYYFGYLLMAMLTKLSGIASNVGYNLALASLYGLTATGAYGIVANLVEGRSRPEPPATAASRQAAQTPRRGRFKWVAPVVVGLLAAVLLVGAGNLQGALEVLRANNTGTPAFWQWVGVKDALQPYQSTTGLPNEHMWWWRSTRVINTLRFDAPPGGGQPTVNDRADYTIEEFPVFSFILGDMHPHVMALPFVMLAIALALDVLRSREAFDRAWLRHNWPGLALAGLCLGALGFLNSWDFPTYAGLFVVAMLGQIYLNRPRPIVALVRDAWPLVAVVLAASIVPFLPFYAGFRSQASGVLPVFGPGTRWVHFGVVWGFFLVVLATFVLIELRGLLVARKGEPGGRAPLWRGLWAILVPLGLVGLWLLARLIGEPIARSAGVSSDSIVSVPDRLVQLLPIAGLAALGAWLFAAKLLQHAAGIPAARVAGAPARIDAGAVRARQAMPAQVDSLDRSGLFVVLLVGVGLLLTLVPELFFIKDVFNNRMNTVFKVYYQAWALLALASAYGLYYVGLRWRRAGALWRASGYVWWGIVFVGFGAVLIYPLAAVANKTGGFARQPTLDGLAYVKAAAAAEYDAVAWLNRNVGGAEVILESVGGQYSEYGRVASRTGLPTVLGWGGHEVQWRGSDRDFRGREQEIDQIFRAPDLDAARPLIEKYQVGLIYAGSLERARYGQAAIDRLSRFGRVVYRNEGVTIFRVPRAADVVGIIAQAS